MKNLKLAVLTIVFALSVGVIVNTNGADVQIKQKISIDVIIGVKSPSPSERSLMKAEEDAHPKMVKAMRNLEAALKNLDAAPTDFGGHKAQAQADLENAYHSIRKALYYRIYEDTH